MYIIIIAERKHRTHVEQKVRVTVYILTEHTHTTLMHTIGVYLHHTCTRTHDSSGELGLGDDCICIHGVHVQYKMHTNLSYVQQRQQVHRQAT